MAIKDFEIKEDGIYKIDYMNDLLCSGCAMRCECAKKSEEEREQQREECYGKEEEYYEIR